MDLNCKSEKMSVCWWCTAKMDLRISDVGTVSPPNPLSPHPPPHHEPYWLMQCLAARLSHFGLLFSFFSFYLNLFSGEMRDISGKFWNHSCWSSTMERARERERDLAGGKKGNSLLPLSSLTGLTAANGQSKLLWEEHRNKRWTAVPWKMYNRTLVFQFSQLY